MREFRGGNRGHDLTRGHSHGSSGAGGEHVRTRTPKEQAADRVALFRSDAEVAASQATKLAEIAQLDKWRAERSIIEKRRAALQSALVDRENDTAVSEQARDHFEAAKSALAQLVEALTVAKEPRPKPPVTGELEIEPRIRDRSAHPDDVLAWAAGLGIDQRNALGARLTDARTPRSEDGDTFAIELCNYLGGARLLTPFRNVLADPKRHFGAAAHARARAVRDAQTESTAPSTEQVTPPLTGAPSAVADTDVREAGSNEPEHVTAKAELTSASVGLDELEVPPPASTESIVSRIIDTGELDATALATIDGTTRRELARRLRAYRPPGGFALGARFIRLEHETRERILAALVAEPMPSQAHSTPSKLPDEVRGDLEHATGRSLGHVNVHAGAHGHAMAQAHGARAVSVGNDIYFGAGQLDPVSAEGRELIAHETAHTVQSDAHPGSVAAAAKRDGGSSDGAEQEADAFAARFRTEGAAATWSPSVPISMSATMRAPAAGQSGGAARAREGYNAKLDNQLAMAARVDANIAAPAFLHLHMPEVRRGVHLFLASRNLSSGDPQVELRDSFFDGLFAAFDGADTAASVTRLRNWVAPADLYALIDRNRPIFENDNAQGTHPSAGLDYQHGPKGPAHWSPAVATAIGSALEPRLIASLARMSPRLVAITARKREAASVSGERPAPVQPSDLVCEHPLDWHVALAMVGRATPATHVKEGALTVSAEANVTYRKVTEVEWQGGHGGAWNALRSITPPDANVAEIAYYVFGKSTEAYRIQRVGPYFVIPEDEAARYMPAAMFRGIASTGANALAFGATAATVETAEVERAVARDREAGHATPPSTANKTALESQWLRVHEQLQGIAFVVRSHGLDVMLGDAVARHHAHKLDLQTLSGKDAENRAELFARQTLLLTKIAAQIGAVASQADERRARTASITAVMMAVGATSHSAQEQSTTETLRRLVYAANLSHLPETGEAAFAAAHTASRDTISDVLEAMLGQAATQIEIARVTMSHSLGGSRRSTSVFGASFQQRADGLRQRLAELRSGLLRGTAAATEIHALFSAIDALRAETGMIAQIGQLGQLFVVLGQLESSNWVLFSEALTAKVSDTTDDNRIGRLETARRGAFELRGDLQTLHSQWLKIQTSANALAEQLAAGGAANAQDQATAAVLPQLDAIRGKLAKLGGDAAVQAFLRDAYDKADSAQTRATVVQIATMVGIAVVSGGTAAMAEGVALGAGATAFGAQLAGLGVETTMFTLLSARLSGEPLLHAFASNFAGNLVTFGAIRATNALVAGSAIGRTLAQAKAGDRVSRLATIAARAAEISAPMLVAIGVQFAQAEAEMLLREGRTLTVDELTATGVQGIAMMIGAAITHKVLGQSMNDAKAFGAEFMARKAQRAHIEQLARDVMAEGDPGQALDLLRETRLHIEAEVAKWQELSKLPTNEMEARGLSEPVVNAMNKNAHARMAALDAMESGTIAAQLGLDAVVPGHVYAGDAREVRRVLDSYRARGYEIELQGGGAYRVSRPDDPAALQIVERQPSSEQRGQHAAGQGSKDSALRPGSKATELTGDDVIQIARLRSLLLQLDNAKAPINGDPPNALVIKQLNEDITSLLDAMGVTGMDAPRIRLVETRLSERQRQVLADRHAPALLAAKRVSGDLNRDGISDEARVGVAGMDVPDKIPRLNNLPAAAAAAQQRFAEAYESAGGKEAMARHYLDSVVADRHPDGRIKTAEETKTFATDEAKLLSEDYNPDSPALTKEQRLAARGMMNLAVHNTANAVAKHAFIMRLDQIKQDGGGMVMVTAGGVAAGKGHAIKNNAIAKEMVDRASVIWDTAGEQNSTELPWVLAEARKRGLTVEILYVHQRPENSWPRVVSRAQKEGRMVDARLHAESYAEGARNFDAFQRANTDVRTVLVDVTGKDPVQIENLPKDALALDADTVHHRNAEYLRTQQGLADAIVAGGIEHGEAVWGPPEHRLAIAQLGGIEISMMPAGTVIAGHEGEALERSTYFVSQADGKRMLELLLKLGPDVETRLFKKGFIVRRAADGKLHEWYFEFNDRALKSGAKQVGRVQGALGLPQPNAATIELWGFSGVRAIDGRTKEAWTPKEKADVARARSQEPLLFAGHIGVSLDGGKTIVGFTPKPPEGVSMAQFLKQLMEHEAFPGILGDDTHIFIKAAEMARERGWDTKPISAALLVDEPKKMEVLDEVARISGMRPGEHGFGYSFPLRPEEQTGNETFAASNGFPAQCVRNCGTFPEKLGVPIPEKTGNVRLYMPELQKWADEEGPKDFRGKPGKESL